MKNTMTGLLMMIVMCSFLSACDAGNDAQKKESDNTEKRIKKLTPESSIFNSKLMKQ